MVDSQQHHHHHHQRHGNLEDAVETADLRDAPEMQDPISQEAEIGCSEMHQASFPEAKQLQNDPSPSNLSQEHKRQAEACSVALEPGIVKNEAAYVATRRLLLYRKALARSIQRQAWQCNEIDYVLYRHFIGSCRNADSQNYASPLSTPGDSGRWTSPSAQSLGYPRDSWSSSKDFLSFHKGASFSSFLSEADPLQSHKEPGDSFVGMHSIFDQFKSSVNVVRFGHRSSELLGFGASDGRLAICTVADPPRMLYKLEGHSKSVTDFDWSLNNHYLCSSSMDRSVRIWDAEKGHCIRVVYDNSEQLCIRFHPVNNNFLLVGNAKGELNVINFSTGRQLCKLSLESNITSIDTDHTGHIVFAGDAQGRIHSVKINSCTGDLSHAHTSRFALRRKSPIMNVQFRTFSRIANGPVLLASSQDGTIRFFSVALEIKGYLSLRYSLKLTPWARSVHAAFCPLLSLEKGEFIVCGSEDANVYFYDFTRPKHPCVNKLQGHGAPVIGVAWNHGENLLASSDCEGTVIVWKRANAWFSA